MFADRPALDLVRFGAESRSLAEQWVTHTVKEVDSFACDLRSALGETPNPAPGSARAVGLSGVRMCEAFAGNWRQLRPMTPARVAEFNRDIALLQTMLDGLATRLVGQQRKALEAQVAIEQASGVLAALGHITPEQACDRLRDYARAHRRGLADLANTVMTNYDEAARVLDRTVEPHSGPMVVSIAGEVDMARTPELRQRLAMACRHVHPPGPLVIDLSGASLLAAAGLGLLTRVRASCGKRGVTLHVVASTRGVVRPLEITGLTERLGVVPSVQYALHATEHTV